jgi:anti-sigma regulatory factor (Ser/Thr protein kinase)
MWVINVSTVRQHDHDDAPTTTTRQAGAATLRVAGAPVAGAHTSVEQAAPHGVRLRFEVPAVAGCVPHIRMVVADLAERHGASRDLLADIRLAVTEACANVVVHAYEGHDEQGRLTVDAEVGPDASLLVRVCDDGRGMAAASGTPGLGLGMGLITSLTDSFLVRSELGRGAEMRLTFNLHR